MSHVRVMFVALCCIDPRFRHEFELFIRFHYRLEPDEYDLKTDAGGVKEIAEDTPAGEWMMRNIDIAVNRHRATHVLLCNHVDCSHYGGSVAFEGSQQELSRYRADLMTAAARIASRFPSVATVDCFIASKEEGRFHFEQVGLPTGAS
jgi:hypothetical protein